MKLDENLFISKNSTQHNRIKENFKLGVSDTQVIRLSNPYNYTIFEYRIDNVNKTLEKGDFVFGKPDKVFHNRREIMRLIDKLKEQGYTEISKSNLKENLETLDLSKLEKDLSNINYVTKVEFDTDNLNELEQLIVLVSYDINIDNVKTWLNNKHTLMTNIKNVFSKYNLVNADPVEDNDTYFYYVLKEKHPIKEDVQDEVTKLNNRLNEIDKELDRNDNNPNFDKTSLFNEMDKIAARLKEIKKQSSLKEDISKDKFVQGDERVISTNEDIYENFVEIASMLTKNSSNSYDYRVGTTYLDYGQKWKWTTIICYEPDESVVQVLSPREWLDIANAKTDADLEKVYNNIINDEYFQDKPNKNKAMREDIEDFDENEISDAIDEFLSENGLDGYDVDLSSFRTLIDDIVNDILEDITPYDDNNTTIEDVIKYYTKDASFADDTIGLLLNAYAAPKNANIENIISMFTQDIKSIINTITNTTNESLKEDLDETPIVDTIKSILSKNKLLVVDNVKNNKLNLKYTDEAYKLMSDNTKEFLKNQMFLNTVELIPDGKSIEISVDTDDYGMEYLIKNKDNVNIKALTKFLNDTLSDTTVKYNIEEMNNDNIDESLKEDLDKEIKNSPEIKDNGLAQMLIDTINAEWDIIKTYNDLIVNAETYGYSDIAEIARELVNDNTINVGQLQKALETVSPNVSSIKDGEEEASKNLEVPTQKTDAHISQEEITAKLN